MSCDEKLPLKMERYSDVTFLMKCTERFLCVRTLGINNGNCFPTLDPICRGLPRGNLSDILFFIVYVSDISGNICNNSMVIADDLEIS